MTHLRLTRTGLEAIRAPLFSVDGSVPSEILCAGDPNLLGRRLVGIFASVNPPNDAAGSALELARDIASDLLEAGETLIGGFHSPAERACLDVALNRRSPAVLVLGRSLARVERLPRLWKKAIAERQLLVISHFDENIGRTTANTARRRNRLAAALADDIIILFATPGGASEALARETLARGKPVLAPDRSFNSLLHALGAYRMDTVRLKESLDRLRLLERS